MSARIDQENDICAGEEDVREGRVVPHDIAQQRLQGSWERVAPRGATLQAAVDAAREEHEAGEYVSADEVHAQLAQWEGRD